MKYLTWLFYGVIALLLVLVISIQATLPKKIYSVTQNNHTTINLTVDDCWIGGCRFKDPQGKSHVFQGQYRQVEQ